MASEQELEAAKSAAFNLLYWSHEIISAAHNRPDSGAAAGLLDALAKQHVEFAKSIVAASPLLDAVSEPQTLAGVSGAGMHDIASSLGNAVYHIARNEFQRHVCTSANTDGYLSVDDLSWLVKTDDGRGRTMSRGFSAAWPFIAGALTKFSEFNCDLAIAEVRRESAKAQLLLAATGGVEGDDHEKIRTDISTDELLAIQPLLKKWPERVAICNAMIAERQRKDGEHTSDQQIAEKTLSEADKPANGADTALKYIRERAKDHRAAEHAK